MRYPNSKLYWIGGWVYDFTKIASFFIFIFLIVHYFFGTVFTVKGISMESTLMDGDIMFVNRIAYRNSPVKRGDIIALYFPGEDEKKFVKRIIALPGEKIEIKNDQVFINDQLMSESYINRIPTRPDQSYLLEKDEFFVMGDNREASSDSRVWGPLRKNYIIGHASYRLFNKYTIINDLSLELRSFYRELINFSAT